MASEVEQRFSAGLVHRLAVGEGGADPDRGQLHGWHSERVPVEDDQVGDLACLKGTWRSSSRACGSASGAVRFTAV